MIILREQETIEETEGSSMNLQVYMDETERETDCCYSAKVYHVLFARVLITHWGTFQIDLNF